MQTTPEGHTKTLTVMYRYQGDNGKWTWVDGERVLLPLPLGDDR